MREAKDEIRYAEGDYAKQLHDEINPIIDKLLKEATFKVLAKIPKKEIDQSFLTPEFGNPNIYDIYNPKFWLRPNPEFFKNRLNELASEAVENSIIHQNFVLIFWEFILRSYDWDSPESLATHNRIRQSAQEYPWFFECYWKGTQASPIDPLTKERIENSL